jgi:hypothetical protein
MGMFDFLKGANTASQGPMLKTRFTDAFADSIQLELKSVATEAIKQALEERENKYMKSILDESYFLLESLLITPKDREVAQRFEEFLTTHESVDTHFSKNFFEKIIQREYRSVRGGSVRVATDFAPTMQLGQASMENMTSEEGFQITLKGRRIMFEAQASLSGPFKKDAPTPLRTPHLAHPNQASSAVHPVHTTSPLVHFKIHDGNGMNTQSLQLPVLIGRDIGTSELHAGWQDLRIASTFVSRHQLVLLEILGDCFFYVPEQASLTCMRSDGSILQKMKLYKLAAQGKELLSLGVDPSLSQTQRPPRGVASEYAEIELSLESLSLPASAGTPRPRAVP